MLFPKKKIKKIYKNNIFLINFVFITLFISFVLSYFIHPNRIFISGDNISSLDYLGHIQNILSDFSSLGLSQLDNTKCIDCTAFYQHSRWAALPTYILLKIGDIFLIHPFIWYLFIIIVTQTIALYYFLKVLFKKVSIFPFIVANLIFIFYPLHFNLFVVSLYGIVNGPFIGGIALLIYLLQEKVISWKKYVYLSILFAFISSFFLNTTIVYLPLYLYSCLFICAYYIKNILKNKIRFLIFGVISFSIIAIINIPILISLFSQITSGSAIKEYGGYISYPFWDSITGLSLGLGLGIPATIIFMICMMFLLVRSKISYRNKYILIGIYLLVTLFLMGSYAYMNIFEQIFLHVPLMKTIRSTYRFGIYQIVIFSIITYSGLLAIKSNILKKVISVLIVSVIFYGVIFTPTPFHSVVVPQEYRELTEYFSTNTDSKIYFPAYVPLFESISGNYSWYTVIPKWKTIYPNPFTSIFAFHNVTTLESIEVSDSVAQLKTQINYELSEAENRKALEFSKVKYVIVDKNFNWEKNFPKFNIDRFTTALKLEKRFGNLYVYRISSKENLCKKSFGNYTLGYCIHKNPQYIIGMNALEYELALLEKRENRHITAKNKKSKIVPGIFNNELLDLIKQQQLFIPFPLFEQYGTFNSLFSIKVKKGDTVLIPILTTNKKNNVYKDSIIQILLDGKQIEQISPYAKEFKITWKEISTLIEDEKDHALDINIESTGEIVIGQPLHFSMSEWKKLKKSAEKNATKYIYINK